MNSLKLYVAGGCEEHGRNCFLLQGELGSILFDCGVLMDGRSVEYPLLDARLVKDVKWMFLSHSHADHSGAIGYLESLGFQGIYAMTNMTFGQLKDIPERCRIIDIASSPMEWQELGDGMRMRWGWSGHCFGSVWYQVVLGGASILFSGDYTEHSPLYSCTPIRSVKADLAILDCAYGDDPRSFAEYASLLLGTVGLYVNSGSPVIFPVPRHGRGLELMLLFQRRFPQLPLYADDTLLVQARRLTVLKGDAIRPLNEARPGGCVFLADPQLYNGLSCLPPRINGRGVVILTGTCEQGSLSQDLLMNGQATFCRFPVHQNLRDVRELVAKNSFDKILLTHAPAGTFDEVLPNERFCVCPPGMGMVV